MVKFNVPDISEEDLLIMLDADWRFPDGHHELRELNDDYYPQSYLILPFKSVGKH